MFKNAKKLRNVEKVLKNSELSTKNLNVQKCSKVKNTKCKKQLTHRLSFAQMLDQMPSELSAAGAKQGVRSVPS